MMGRDVRESVVLIVDDEQANLDLLEACLADDGYRHLHCVRDPREVMARYEALGPDIVLLDLHMPHLDGFALMEQLLERVAPGDFLPILVLTADITTGAKTRALSGGAKDFLSKPFDLGEVVQRIANLLEIRHLHREEREARRVAEDAEGRSRILAEAGRILATSFDYHTTLSSLARLAVPTVADYAVVDVLQEDGSIARVGVAHVDSAKEALLRESGHLEAGRLPGAHPEMGALLEGRESMITEITPEAIDELAADEEHRRIIEALSPGSLIAVPLQAPGRVIGSLVLAHAESGRRFGMADFRLAQELAARCVLGGVQTIVFGRSRLTTELLLTYMRERVARGWASGTAGAGTGGAGTEGMGKVRNRREVAAGLLPPDSPVYSQIRGYRGGYLPTERREVDPSGNVRVRVTVRTCCCCCGSRDSYSGYVPPAPITGTGPQAPPSRRPVAPPAEAETPPGVPPVASLPPLRTIPPVSGGFPGGVPVDAPGPFPPVATSGLPWWLSLVAAPLALLDAGDSEDFPEGILCGDDSGLRTGPMRPRCN